MRRLGVLVRHLPMESALVSAITGQRRWNPTDLLADVWTVMVLANSAKGALPDDFDHPVRAEMAAAAKAEHRQELQDKFRQRKRAYARSA